MANSEIYHLFEIQRAEHWKVARCDADQRIAKLARLKETILSHRHALHDGFWVDFHKHPDEVDLTEIYPTLVELEQARLHLPDWMRPVRVKTPLLLAGTHSELRYEPRGVVLILVPWNYPFQLLFVPLIATVAAGNCAIVRPSHKVPTISAVIARIIGEAFPKTEVACVTESGTKLAEELLNMPFDHIFFTGSRAVGKKVMTAAAANLASVTLELGGKSPLVIDETADVEQAAERAIWGKMINAGQTCIAPDFALVHERTVSAFVDVAKRKIAELYGETEEDRQASRDLARIIDNAAFRRLCAMIESSVAAGARIEIGGRADPSERYIAPTILTNVSWDTVIMQEEIFGPILPVLSFRALKDVPAQINALGQPLALYIFSHSQENVDFVLAQTTSGAVGINEVVLHNANPNLPFGGVGQSGQGNYHGWYGFRTFSQERSIMRQARLDLLHTLYPPYGKKTELILELMGKFAF